MLKKIKGWIVYSLIILLFVFCCTSFKSNVIVKNKSAVSIETLLDEKYRSASTNFVYLAKEIIPSASCKLLQGSIPCARLMHSTASGFVFSSDKDTMFVMTAAHFCKKEEIPGFSQNITGLIGELARDMFVVYYDEQSDICMMLGTKFPEETFLNTRLASKLPKIGESVYTVAAPNGIGGPDFRLIFEGKFGGCSEDMCMSTIPATFGSSGAGIFNKRGELITIVMAVTEGFENVILSPSNLQIKEFVDKVDQVVDIYP